MATIGSLGAGSGLDLESLLQKLITAEGTPRLSALTRREAAIQADISAFGSLKSALDQFRAGVRALSAADALQQRTVSTGNSAYFSASAGAAAAAGTNSIQVLGTARAQRLISGASFADAGATVGEGTLTITLGDASFEVTTSATTTLAELRTLINEAAGDSGLAATLMVVAVDPLDASAGTVTRLMLSSEKTGSANTIAVAVDDADAADTDDQGLSRFYFSASDPLNSQLDEQQAAADARIVVNGFTAWSATNTFADVLEGVTISALKDPEDPLAPVVETLTVALDRAGVAARVKSFVNGYNEVVKAIRSVSSYDTATRAAGALNGDATVRGIGSRLRAIIGSQAPQAGGIGSLAQLGISTQRDGTLAVDAAKLDAALAGGFGDVAALFQGEDGIAVRLEETLDAYLDSDGLLASRTRGLDRQLAQIGTERESLNTRLEKIEAQYRTRFAALDALVAQLQSTGSYLDTQLANTSSIIGGRSR